MGNSVEYSITTFCVVSSGGPDECAYALHRGERDWGAVEGGRGQPESTKAAAAAAASRLSELQFQDEKRNTDDHGSEFSKEVGGKEQEMAAIEAEREAERRHKQLEEEDQNTVRVTHIPHSSEFC